MCDCIVSQMSALYLGRVRFTGGIWVQTSYCKLGQEMVSVIIWVGSFMSAQPDVHWFWLKSII